MHLLNIIIGFGVSQLFVYFFFPKTSLLTTIRLVITALKENEAFSIGFITGIVLLLVLRYLSGFLFAGEKFELFKHHGREKQMPDGVQGGVYGLEHAVLNLEVPPKEMWMNMGFWEDGNSHSLPDACRALLNEVLRIAGLWNSETDTPTSSPRKQIKIIDLGFGCGDQTLHLAQLSHPAKSDQENKFQAEKSFLCSEYIGITLEKRQFLLAQQRVKQHQKFSSNPRRIQVFCADAAKPLSWSPDLVTAAETLVQNPGDAETWVLALDTLYHFLPSRQAIFNHSYNSFNANLMTFDLLLADENSATHPPLLQRLLLRIVALGSATPYSNFLTRRQYKAQLVAAGYEEDEIVIQDVSERVFNGLAGFLGAQNGRLKALGLGEGIGRFRVAKWVFGWWGRSGIVRGCVIVARRKSKEKDLRP